MTEKVFAMESHKGDKMSKLSKDTVLQRLPDLEVRLGSNNHAFITILGSELEFGSHSLAILDAFSLPCSFSNALECLKSRAKGSQDWIDLTNTIVQLHDAGVLQDVNSDGPAPPSGQNSFYDARLHILLLNDRVRTSSYISGIEEVVLSGDVVLDIGTGTGVLAVAAARAGARHVYAIEAGGIGDLAQAVFEANGLSDRITLIRGWSTQVHLPERADVLVSEIISNNPLSRQRVLEATTDAMKRLLKRDARLVPNKVRIFGLPVTIPRDELRKHIFTADAIQDWRCWYNIEFSPLEEIAHKTSHIFHTSPKKNKTQEWKTLSDSVLLAEVVFDRVNFPVIDRSVPVIANSSGELCGILLFFELELGPSISLSTDPRQEDRANCWDNPVWICTHPLTVREGDSFRVNYTYNSPHAPNGVRLFRP